MSDQMGGYNPPAGYQPQGGYPQQQAGYGTPQGGYPQQQQGGWGQSPGYGQQQPAYGAPQQPASGGGVRFDLQSIMPGGAIAVASGLLLFVISFFRWWEAKIDFCEGLPIPTSQCSTTVGAKAWDRGITEFALILSLIIVVAFVVKALHVLPSSVPVELVAAGILVLADIFFLITFLTKGASGPAAGFIHRGWAQYVGLLFVVGLNAGVIMALLNSGGLSSLKGGLAKMQTPSAGTGGYGQQQQWGQQPQQQQWGQQAQQAQQWGQQPAQPQPQQQGWPAGPSTGSQPYQSGQQPQTGGQPAQPSWGQQPEQQRGWPSQEQPAQPGWGQQPQQPPQQGWPQQQRPEEQQQGGWPPQQPPQQGGWPQ